MLRNEDLELKHANADGNCAYNALALRFVEDDIIDNLQENLINNGSEQDVKVFNDLLAKLRPVLSLSVSATWLEIKKRLKEIRDTNRDELQGILAPLLRDLAIVLIKKNPEDEMTVLLGPAFREYAYNFFGIPLSESGFRGDDILKPHAFVTKKFRNSLDNIIAELQRLDKSNFDYKQFLSLQSASDAASQVQLQSMRIKLRDVLEPLLETQVKNVLESWWLHGKKGDKEKSKSGREQFLEAIGQQAESSEQTHRYAGDFELATLCRCFKINLVAQRNENNFRLTDIKGKKGPVPVAILVNEGNHWNYLAPKKPAGNPVATLKEVKVNPSSEVRTPKSSLFSTHNVVDPNVAINDVNAISKVLKATTSSPSWVDLGRQAQDQKSASQKIKLKLGNETIEEKTDGTVQYSFFLNPGKANSTLLTTITVTADDQKKLDAVLARQLQEEEYEEYRNSLKK